MQNWIDSHAHLSDSRIQFGDVVARAKSVGVVRFGMAGVDAADFNRQREIQSQLQDNVRTCVGLHPWAVTAQASVTLSALAEVEKSAPMADWIGETGLDFQDRFSSDQREQQKIAFARCLELAETGRKPLILHVVRAHAEVLAALRGRSGGGNSGTRGMVHSFSGSVAEMKQYLDLGFLISFSGAAFRPGRDKVQTAFQECPLDFLLLESDTPDQPLNPAAKFSEPADLVVIARAAYRLRTDCATPEFLLDTVTKNAERTLWKRM